MTNDPTKPPPLDGNDSTSASMTFYDLQPVISHDALDDMRKRLIVLEGMQRSASCQRGWLVAAIALLFAGMVALAWVLM